MGRWFRYVDLTYNLQTYRPQHPQAEDASDLHPQRSSLSVDMLQTCLKNLGVTNDSGILKLKSFGTIQRCLPWEDRKKVAVQVLSCTLESHESEPVSTPKQITTLLTFAMPLVTDEDDAPGDQSTKSSSFAKEQAMIAKLVQSLDNDDLAVLAVSHFKKSNSLVSFYL